MPAKTKSRPKRNRSCPLVPTLRFTPYAWSKLLYLRDRGETEVGGFGLSTPDDLFCIEDIRLIRQHTTVASVEFDDDAVTDFYDEQVDQGRQLEQFSRVWLHTHPGESAEPSNTDEQTFERVFGHVAWSVMMILARGGESYARLRFGSGPTAELEVPIDIAWEFPFPESDHAAWDDEYDRCVQPVHQTEWSNLKDLAGVPLDEEFVLPTDPRFLDFERSSFFDDEFDHF